MPVLAMFMTANRAILAHSGIYLRFLTSEDNRGQRGYPQAAVLPDLQRSLHHL